MTRRALTATEARVLMVVRAFHKLDPPRAPVLREIAEAMGWKGTSTAQQYVDQLVAAGYVHKHESRVGVFIEPEAEAPDDPPLPAPDPA